MKDDPNDDRAAAWQKALADAYEQIAKLDSTELSHLQYELIERFVEVYRKELGGKMEFHIVPEVVKAFKHFKVGGDIKVSKTTIGEALRFMKAKREAEGAHAKEVKDTRPRQKRESPE